MLMTGFRMLRQEFHVVTAESYSYIFTEPDVFQKPKWLQEAPPPQLLFNDNLFVFGELDIAIKMTKSSSSHNSPHDKVPYLVFKKCPAPLWLKLCWNCSTVLEAPISIIHLPR